MNDLITKRFTNLTKKQWTLMGAVGAIILIPVLLLLMGSGQSGKGSEQGSSQPTPIQPLSQNIVPPTPTPLYRTSLLSFKQQTASSTAVVIDTGGRSASAVQLEIGFDPLVLKSIHVTPGNFFEKSLVLLSNVDYQKGSIFFAVVMPPGGMPKTGKGTVAVVSYSFADGAFNPTTLQFLSKTKVTSEGIDDTILKLASNITISAASQ